jgi:hypothetical protein
MRVGVNRALESVQLTRAMHHVPATEQQRVHRRVSRFSIGCDPDIVLENQSRTVTSNTMKCQMSPRISVRERKQRCGYLQYHLKYKPRSRVSYETEGGSCFTISFYCGTGSTVSYNICVGWVCVGLEDEGEENLHFRLLVDLIEHCLGR